MTEPAAPGWRIGETAPWVVPWTGEMRFTLAPSASFPGRVEVVQISNPGVGEPVMGAMHLHRQRQGVTGHLCHVCGSATTAADRWLFPVVGGTLAHVKGAVGDRYLSHLPPIHAACAALAQRACPHLSRQGAQPIAFPREEGEIMCETSVPEGMAAFAADLPAGVRPISAYFRVFGPAISRLVAPGNVAELADALQAMLASPPQVNEEIPSRFNIPWSRSAEMVTSVLRTAADRHLPIEPETELAVQ